VATSLTNIAITARKSIRYSIYLVVVLIVARVVLGIVVNVYKAVVPPRVPPATVGFNRLALINFPPPTVELPDLEYTIETATGTLPVFPEQMDVYAMPQKAANLSSFDKMKSNALAFGFGGEPIQTTERLYKFSHLLAPVTFEADIVTEVFSVSYKLASDTSPLQSRSPTVESATQTASGLLKSAGLLTEDLSGPVGHIFLKVEGQNMVKALSLSDAQFVQVNLFRKSFGENQEYPSVTSNPDKANVWFIVSGSIDQEKQIIAGEYRYFNVDQELVETYPIKTAEQALQDLVAGRGYISSLGLNVDGNVTIRNIYLGYYDPNVPSAFYQPIVIFEGDDNFLAYVPAVVNEYLESSQP